MGYIRASFLGKEYSIPEDVLLYIDLLEFTGNVKTRLINTFVRKLKSEIQKGNVACVNDKDLAPEIEQQVGKYIAMLTEHGIYDRTVNDYLRQNEGYKLISKVNAAALEEARRALKQQMSDWLEGYEGAIQKKDASVTGLGFSIWSSSFVNHAIYAAMEASKVNEQEKAAAKEYQKDMAELRTRLENRKNADEQRYVANTYIPNMEAAITVFSYALLDTFVSDLIKFGELNKEVLNYIHIDRSNDLLKNLELSQNKPAVLLKAFEACPYNLAVYMQAMKHDLLDYDTFQTAKMFGHGNTIISFLEENLGGTANSEKKQLNFKNAELLSLYSGRNLREITAYMADFIVDGYAETIAALSDTTPCYNIMNKAEERAILAGNSISKQKADWLVDPLAPVVLWDKLTSEYGHTDLFDRLLNLLPNRPEMNSKQEYDAFLKNRLFSILETIRQERAAKIHEQQREESRKRVEEAEKAQRTAKRNKRIKIICLVAVAVAIIIAIISSVITKANNAKAYQNMAGEFCVYRVINDDGEERDEFNWWLSIGEDGTMKMSSWSYAFYDTAVNSYSGELKNKADFRKFEDYHIEDFRADVSDYEEALYCYEFHIADEWDEFDGYIVCWQYHNGKIVDVYCDDYRYSFVETSDDYSFNKWESEINSDKLSKNVENLVENVDVSEKDVIDEVENLISSGNYEEAIEAIVASKLSDEQKNTYYDSLVKKIGFKSFDVNGLMFNIPEHWFVREYSDPNIKEAKYSEDDSLFYWYVKYLGTADQVADEGNDYWKTRDDFSQASIPGCTNAYVRFDSGHDNKDEQYFVIEHFVECDGQVYQIQYLAYKDRYFEPEVWMLLDHVEFSDYTENSKDIHSGTTETNATYDQSLTWYNVELASSFLGKELNADGSLSMGPSDYEVLSNDMYLFGIPGRCSHGWSSVAEDPVIIDILDWVTTKPVDDFNIILNPLIGRYGNDYRIQHYNDAAGDAYMWKNVEMYEYVICWQNADGTVDIRWTISK